MTHDPFAIAAEHIAYCLRRGDKPADVFAALGEACPAEPSWNAAIWAVAWLADDVRGLGRTDDVLTIYPPFRAPRRAA